MLDTPKIASISDTWSGQESLSHLYYTSKEVYDVDINMITDSQWLLAGHISQIPKRGDFFLFEVGIENIIVTRESPERIRAFYNVCRHRGSRICTKPAGSVRTLTCPYHSWSWNLDGTMRGAPQMPAEFRKELYNLHEVHVGVFEGIIFLNFSASEPPSFEEFVCRFRDMVQPHQLAKTKIAYRKSYPTTANWKLVAENFQECYHCGPSHPTYCSVHSKVKLLGFIGGRSVGTTEAVAAFEPLMVNWEEKASAMGHYTGRFTDDCDSPHMQQGVRTPYLTDAETETRDGKLVAPFLGSYTQSDGASSYAVFCPLNTALINADYAVLISFIPRGVNSTDVECIWLVHEDAVEGKDYDVARLIDVWDTTLTEDKKIVEDNQLGVNSSVYKPGPHSYMEAGATSVVGWYLKQYGRYMGSGRT
ncbi:aromatic ring-hydroxylating dioxygenase subunit alpha [Mesorhizobium sp.]|uniref:aromatic ring-hydroxylating dioxygenase subunit alpha n=1 Tax=Mesorhizobium sp. TaxID=1871066 RepID=UPI000FE9C887|nr:aromatic ring-hydroxylating dioxygenase subunit alpha [Mesorhizobium sp.]RWK94367.1 MAG: aromatic ring-hydroxylating dioxygenase subunit alpha [Mesorhizobium sp.]TIQ27469.1 MAG: aromatic ring-hydroxylating dioxygenase subunit alpha [Mesorhizobium sp.]